MQEIKLIKDGKHILFQRLDGSTFFTMYYAASEYEKVKVGLIKSNKFKILNES